MRAKSLICLSIAFCMLFFAPSAHADIAVGQAAPALVTKTLDGKDFDLSSLKGQVTVVHFWATWCGPCREEMPALEAVWRKYHGLGLQVLAVSADRPRSKGDVDQVMHYFTFPAALLSSLSKNDFGTPTSIPITYVIGKDGNIDEILTPDIQPLTETHLGDEVKKLIDAKADSKPVDTKPTDNKPSDSQPETKTDTKS